MASVKTLDRSGMAWYFAETDVVPDSCMVLCLPRAMAEVGSICRRSLSAASKNIGGVL